MDITRYDYWLDIIEVARPIVIRFRCGMFATHSPALICRFVHSTRLFQRAFVPFVAHDDTWRLSCELRCFEFKWIRLLRWHNQNMCQSTNSPNEWISHVASIQLATFYFECGECERESLSQFIYSNLWVRTMHCAAVGNLCWCVGPILNCYYLGRNPR